MIKVNNVTKKYGKFVAIENVSFEIKKGEIVGFLGPNGAGKTTTMNIITGYIEPTTGTVKINGYDISKKSKKAKQCIGYMPENVPLYKELTVYEFVQYMGELRNIKKKELKEQIEKLLKELDLEGVKNKIIRNLSRGYKQRVSLAGALVGNPEILILDEPTVGLDPKQIVEIRKIIKNLGKKYTVLISSHILSEISQICDKVIIIKQGKIIAQDETKKIKNKTKQRESIIITIEDKKDNINKIKEEIKEIQEIVKIKDNQDGTIEYCIYVEKDKDIRRKLFEVLPQKEMVIFEIRKNETTLEDAFIEYIKEEGGEK